nr:Inner membrane protein YiaH [Candidatus Pantoea persica]
MQAHYLALLVLAVLANPNTVDQAVGPFHWLPVNLYVSGDSIYYLLYALLGRAIGTMDTAGGGAIRRLRSGHYARHQAGADR